MSHSFNINPDIAKAETLPSLFYKNQDVFDKVKEKIFLKSWQWLGDNSGLKLTNSIQPLTLLDGFLSEPILLTRDSEGLLNCMSNVCTHRGNILALGADKVKFFGQVTPKAKIVRYEIDIKRVVNRGAVVGFADGNMFVDDRHVYSADGLRVGLFKDTSEF